MHHMKQAIATREVRILTGVFGTGSEYMANICRSCGACGTQALCQPWRIQVQHYPGEKHYVFPAATKSRSRGLDGSQTPAGARARALTVHLRTLKSAEASN